MGRTGDEELIPVPAAYRELLLAAVARFGSQQKVASEAKLDQATISRTLKVDGKASYTTLMKLSRALPGMPIPVLPIQGLEHAQWCELGAVLLELDKTGFAKLLGQAIRDAKARGVPDRNWSGLPNKEPSEIEIQTLKSTILKPLRKPKRGADRGT